VQRFDPDRGRDGQFVTEIETSSERVRHKLGRGFKDPFRWCFCDLCWRETEYVVADALRRVFKRTGPETARPVKFSANIYLEVQAEIDAQANQYEKSLRDTLACLNPVPLQFAAKIAERVEEFRLQQDDLVRFQAWASRGNVMTAARLPSQGKGAAKPSKFYCEMHNPRRSDEARRNYQRDRRFAAEYAELIAVYWEAVAGQVRIWKMEEHRQARKLAYRKLLSIKKPTLFIEEMQKEGHTNLAEIARHLGVSRQAVSAAVKRNRRNLPHKLPKPPPP